MTEKAAATTGLMAIVAYVAYFAIVGRACNAGTRPIWAPTGRFGVFNASLMAWDGAEAL